MTHDAPESDAQDDLLANASANPVIEEPVVEETPANDERVSIFLHLSGVGEATAYALADGGYGTIGDIIADTAEEVAQKTGLSLGVAENSANGPLIDICNLNRKQTFGGLKERMSKVRVYELARELKIESKVLVSKVKEMGIDVSSHQSTLSADQVVRRLNDKCKEEQPKLRKL